MSEEDLFFCPLECGARIKNLVKHMQKCKNYPLLGVKYKLCEYNNSHIIRNELYETHLLTCKSKKKYEEDESDSVDDDLDDKFNDCSENEKKEEVKKVDTNKIENNVEKKNENTNENEENNINKRKRRYRHEKALFKDENEIDQECLDFFNKVYI